LQEQSAKSRFAQAIWPKYELTIRRCQEKYDNPSASGLRLYLRAPMALASGANLGPYEIQSPLGAGGMGDELK
jgi:hypothetical protein